MHLRCQFSNAESNVGIQSFEINVYMYVRCQFSNAESNVGTQSLGLDM